MTRSSGESGGKSKIVMVQMDSSGSEDVFFSNGNDE